MTDCFYTQRNHSLSINVTAAAASAHSTVSYRFTVLCTSAHSTSKHHNITLTLITYTNTAILVTPLVLVVPVVLLVVFTTVYQMQPWLHYEPYIMLSINSNFSRD